MPKTNSRAIAKLIDAQKILKKQGRNADTSAGQAFARDLIRILETGKPAILTMGDDSYPFKPADVRVSRTRVGIGGFDASLCHLAGGTDGDYELTILVSDVPGAELAETYEVRLELAA